MGFDNLILFKTYDCTYNSKTIVPQLIVQDTQINQCIATMYKKINISLVDET